MKWFDEENKSFWDKWHRDQDKNRPDYRFEVPPPVPGPPKRGKTSAEKEIARLEDLGDRNWSRPQDLTMKQLGLSSESEEGKRTEKAITAPSRETEAEKEARHKIINGLREERIQQIKDEERWKKLRLHGEENLRSNPSYSKDEERNALKTALGLEKDYNKALNDMLKGGKVSIKDLAILEQKAKESREAFLRGKFNYPNVAVTRTVNGDKEYAERFRGMADELLYTVKNKKALDGLDSSWGQRKYSDGTVIRVTSLIRQDYVEIDVLKLTAVEGGCTCRITLINVPLIIQPMRYPEQIHAGEVEDADYIKTYYTVEKSGGGCGILDWTVCDTAELQLDVGFVSGGTQCTPFKYTEPANQPYYMGDPTTTPPNPPDPEKHCIYSMWDHCQGEIITTGRDSGGDYIIWKAYTEWSNQGWHSVDFSRTGLGYMKLKAFINNKSGKEICSAEAIVKVDCCHKPVVNRVVRMWWEWITAGQGFMFVGSGQFWPCPDTMNKYRLYDYCILDTGRFYIFPEIEGACLPYTWKLQGIGKLEAPGMFNASMSYRPIDGPYLNDLTCAPIIIEVEDRCGTKDTLIADCCPEVDGTISIGYTSLSMSCDEVQDLTVTGARISSCPPYSWSVSGGGTVVASNASGDTVVYTAPSTNPDCANNPTITVTDCCGHSASISLAVNCYTGGGAALRDCSYVECNSSCAPFWMGTFCQITYDCEGALIAQTAWDGSGPATCGECGTASWLTCPIAAWVTPRCGALAAGICTSPDQPCGTFWDIRTVAMKEGGCCPLNPFTGLPY